MKTNDKPKLFQRILSTIWVKLLPVYIPAGRGCVLAMWSAPRMPVKSWMDYFSSLRVTIRKNGNPIAVIKKGTL